MRQNWQRPCSRSHLRRMTENAQVAILDTYKGAAKGAPRIMELKKNSTVSEELRYDSVVAVNPGEYEVELMGDDGLVKSQSRLVALNHESYVVLRTGVEAQQGQQYPEELIVFPQSDPSTLHSGSAALTATLSFMAVCAALLQ